MKYEKMHITLFAIVMLTVTTAVVTANTITLRTSVRLIDNADIVRLGDIATIQGNEAEQYAEVPIATIDDPSRVMEVHVRLVRQALDAEGVHWGRVHLNGSRVLVRPRGRATASPPLAMTGASVESPKNSSAADDRAERDREPTLAKAFMQERTLRSAIATFLLTNMGVDAERLRLEFDPRDDATLDASLDELRFEIEPVSSIESNRIDLAVRLWNDGRSRERVTVRVRPTVHMPVVMLKRDVSRGTRLTEEDIEVSHQWLQPVHSGLVTSEQEAIGRIATIRLRAGESLREQHVKRETLIRRGDRVVVRTLVGGSVLTMQAEARDSGSEGDTIEFRKIGERDTFLATVTGRNEALIDLQRR